MTMSITDVVITCCNTECGISFAVPEWWNRGKRETHTKFFCPNGHGQSYPQESDTEKLRRERDRLQQQMARVEDEKRLAIKEMEAAERKAVRAEAETKRMKKRAAAGTCPCCQRSFSNMSQHMRKQHPKFVAEETTNVVALKR